jgi:hypothetical protein
MRFQDRLKTVLLMTAVMLPFVAVSFNIPSTQALVISSTRDCDSNAVLNCGALSVSELQGKYNSSSSARVIYAHYGITAADIGAMTRTAVAGEVTSGGAVIVNGRTVATGAITQGRQNIAGSRQVTSGGVTFFERPPRVSFVSSPLPAFVAMHSNGVFAFAIIASCGNAVIATPVARPVVKPAPRPTPAPTPTPTPAPRPTPAAPTQQQQQQQQQSQTVIVASPTPTPVPAPAPQVQQQAQQQQTPTQQQQQQQPQPAPAPAPTPVQIPNTGPGNALGLGALVSFASGGAHYFVKRKRLS